MSSINASPDFSQVKPEELQRFLDIFGHDVTDVVNGKLDFQTNFNCNLLSITFTSGSTNTTISHSLGRTPIGYVITGLSAPIIVYDGTLSNTSSVLVLRASAAGTAKLLVY